MLNGMLTTDETRGKKKREGKMNKGKGKKEVKKRTSRENDNNVRRTWCV